MTMFPIIGPIPNSRYTARATAMPAHMVIFDERLSRRAGLARRALPPTLAPLVTGALVSSVVVTMTRLRCGLPVRLVLGGRLGRSDLALGYLQLQVRPGGGLIVGSVTRGHRREHVREVNALSEPRADRRGREAVEVPAGLGGGDAGGVHILGVDLRA